jgi:hypothetical protein
MQIENLNPKLFFTNEGKIVKMQVENFFKIYEFIVEE